MDRKIDKKYDAEAVMKELLAVVVDVYQETGEMKLTAEELSMSAIKVRKLLITAGEYHSELADEVGELFAAGKTVQEIREITGLGRSSVNGYLSYTKVPYNAREISLNAERIRVYRRRRECVKRLNDELSEEALWETVVAFQKYPFHTEGKGLPFSYELKVGRDGTYNRELVVNRRKESKTLAWSSVRLAFQKALGRRGEVVRRPKELGDIRGISYVYAMFLRWGIVRGEDSSSEPSAPRSE